MVEVVTTATESGHEVTHWTWRADNPLVEAPRWVSWPDRSAEGRWRTEGDAPPVQGF